MLKQRILTALVLIPIVIGVIFYAPIELFASFIGAVSLLAAREWANLNGLKTLAGQLPYMIAVAVLVMMLAMMPGIVFVLFAATTVFWIGNSFTLVMRNKPLEQVDGLRPGMLAMGVLILSSVFLAMIQLHQTPAIGSGLVMFLFVLIWVADSGAYFAGRAFGKHKLSPHVSPGKTWEGALGALLGAVVCGVVLHRFEWFELSLMQLVFVCVATAWVSIGGDLFESVMKRQAGMKDSGYLLPGHGGVLDRIDSLLAAAPVFLMLVALAGGLK